MAVAQQREKKRNKKHMLDGTHIQFPIEKRRHKEQGGNIPLPQTTRHLIRWLLFGFPDPETKRCCYETLSAGYILPPKAAVWHSHLMLKEALLDWTNSPVAAFSATHTKFPASSRRSTAVNFRLLPSWKRRSSCCRRSPLWSHLYVKSAGSLTSQRSIALRPCKASWDVGSLVK